MKIHFIGIDGISMSALAAIMQHNGHKVSGSDLKTSHLSQRLIENGATVFLQQVADNIAKIKPDKVVYTAAIKSSNEELIAARKLGVPVLERSEFLGELTAEYSKSIAVAGSHGKTTTTAMLATALIKGDANPTALVGGDLGFISGNVYIGNSDVLLTEACEYVESFLHLNPYIGIVLNIDRDHLDYFKNIGHITKSFKSFAKKIVPNGFLVINGDDEKAKNIVDSLVCNVVTFGLANGNDWVAKDITYEDGGSKFTAIYKDEVTIDIELRVPGKHNIYNCLSVIASCYILKLDLNSTKKALYEYIGTKRRFEKRGELNGALLVDDYAHHPKEITTTLQAVRDSLKPKRLIVAFQPHTYTRTKSLLAEFAGAFAGADKVIVTHTYAAREPYDATADSKTLTRAISECHNDVIFIKEYHEVAKEIKAILQPGDLFITMGAGPVDEVIDLLLN